MASKKEIVSKIKSTKNTRKITKAMQMVATSKLKKTQDRMRKSRPYAEKVREIMSHIAQINGCDLQSMPFLRNNLDKINSVGIILIGTDKGLCGGLNANSLRIFYQKIKDFREKNINIQVCALGQKANNAYNRVRGVDIELASSAIGLGDTPKMNTIIGPLFSMINKFYNQEIDAVYVIYSKFINTMRQQSTFEQILPLSSGDLKTQDKLSWDYIYEPSSESVLNDLVKRYIESVIYQCLCDNMASEQAARMIAMKSATDNASKAIHQLNLQYNKSRQAAITQEIAEIISGTKF